MRLLNSAKKRKASLFSFMNSSKDSSDKEAIVIAKDPPLQAAVPQKVTEKALENVKTTKEPSLSSVLKLSKRFY
jgi:hypothetical protein